MIAQWRSNRGGFAGLVLSIVQLLLHALWIGITETLSALGEPENFTANSWQAWLIVGLLLLSGTVTMLALFLSLHGSINGRPRTPAVIGLTVSFFTGAFVTFILLLTALGSGVQP
jgi:hypothetical protein